MAITVLDSTEHQLHLVRGAIDLVAAGGARRVTLVALGSAEALLPSAQALARARGLVVRAIWRPRDAGCDLAIEAVA